MHIKSTKEKDTGDWIEITNNYNFPIDLSLYKIIVKDGQKEEEFVFPIGSQLSHLANLYLTNNYSSFIKHHENNSAVVGGFPKLGLTSTSIQLYNRDGYLIDSYSYSVSSENAEDITFVSNGVNDKKNKNWKTITK